jgi:hypothetical protein
VLSVGFPEASAGAQILTGDAAASELIAKLKNEARVI